MPYLHTDETTISNFEPSFIDEMYEKGYVFTRIDKGVMHQTRSVRINLSKFELSSENRRVIKKTSELALTTSPIPFAEYDFTIGKMARDFYTAKFGENIMSAQKIKEMLTDTEKTNFNILLKYSDGTMEMNDTSSSNNIGFTISFKSKKILHYSYPFYDLATAPKDIGLGMMLRAIIFAKESGLKYIYLGSLQRASDTYKLQFQGLEWFDSTKWSDDIDAVKNILSEIK